MPAAPDWLMDCCEIGRTTAFLTWQIAWAPTLPRSQAVRPYFPSRFSNLLTKYGCLSIQLAANGFQEFFRGLDAVRLGKSRALVFDAQITVKPGVGNDFQHLAIVDLRFIPLLIEIIALGTHTLRVRHELSDAHIAIIFFVVGEVEVAEVWQCPTRW